MLREKHVTSDKEKRFPAFPLLRTVLESFPSQINALPNRPTVYLRLLCFDSVQLHHQHNEQRVCYDDKSHFPQMSSEKL
jgi:hypothetical protein